MVAPAVIAAIIGAVGSIGAAKMQAEAQKMQGLGNRAPGGGFSLGTGTDKFMKRINDLNENPDDKRQLGEGMVSGALGDALNRGANDQFSLGLAASAQNDPAQNFSQAMSGSEQGAEKGFDMDNALQYAAMAGALGSMLSGPPPPRPPGLPGGGGFRVEPFTMRSTYGR
jgi:hypothetical protein